MSVLGNISDILVIVTGVLFVVIAIVDFLGDCYFMGRVGAKFSYENNVVFGGLLGIAYYSKVEGVLFALLALGCFQIFGVGEQKQLWITIGIMGGAAYMITCIVYGTIAKLNLTPFIAIAVLLCLLDIWRIYAFLQVDDYGIALGVFVAMCILVALAAWRMKSRAEGQRATLQRFTAIQTHCKEHPDFSWNIGEDCPVGFVAPQTA